MDRRLIMLGAVVAAVACHGGADSGAGETDPGTGTADTAEGSAGETDPDGEASCADPDDVLPIRSPLRRLTRFEYNNSVRDLLGDTTSPANAFPSEVLSNGFGNDADAQSVSSLLAEQYLAVAEDVADRATDTSAKLADLASCAADIDENTGTDAENACAREVIETFAAKAFRRPVDAGEVDELLELGASVRDGASFSVSVAAMLAAVLQAPDFLYRIEFGEVDEDGRRRPTSHEMASRLSYFLWGSTPDAELLDLAAGDELRNPETIRAQAERLLDDPKAVVMVRHFFDNALPISDLHALERDDMRYPTYSASIGSLMREESQQLLEHVIFDDRGSWPDALTADHTYLNAELAAYYGVDGVQGDDFVRVDLDTSRRLGLLTHAGVVAGTIHANETNPVTRGSFIVQRMMCREVPLPEGGVLAEVRPPDPDAGATARERYSQHSEDPLCASCHALMDPVGLALENYDAVGLWRNQENGVTIDASGSVPGSEGTVDGPVELVRKIAEAPETSACFAEHWSNFAYGRTLTDVAEEACLRSRLEDAFVAADYEIYALLLELTQTDAFLYLPAEEGS